jgi:CHAT domain-containing protein
MVRSNVADSAAATDESLLLVGDIDYDAVVASSAVPAKRAADDATATIGRPRHLAAMPSGALPRFPSLPGTKQEIAKLAKAWPGGNGQKSFVKLSGADASADRFCQAAPSATFIHVATHGYYAPAGLRSAFGRFKPENLPPGLLLEHGDLFGLDVVGHHPGVLSGLALAGANRFGRSGDEDQFGADSSNRILSALEVEGLDLPRARLVVLSACETGLGEGAHGEGSFSLQRAFHVAGAQTVVSSLWQVPDRATALLMARFYRNLWKEKMPRLAALREAQRWLREEAKRNPELLLRGFVLLDDEENAKIKSGHIPPRIWAGFVLSGDWR